MGKMQALHNQYKTVRKISSFALIVILSLTISLANTVLAQSECFLQCERQYSQCQGSPHICELLYDGCIESCL